MLRPSTKDNTHLRRCTKRELRFINFTPEMKLQGNKDYFLSNVSNKKNAIQLIGSQLQHENCRVVYTEEDADLNIAVTACNDVLTKLVTAIGEDCDILIFLLYYSTMCNSTFNLTYRSDISKSEHRNVHNIFQYRDASGSNCSSQINSVVITQLHHFLVLESKLYLIYS